MKAAAPQPISTTPQRFRSLRRKVFFPFFILIIVLFLAAIAGTVRIANQSYKNSSDQRLAAASEVLFREFKKQEIILSTYAVMMQQFQKLSEQAHENPELGILQDRLFNTLETSNISTTFFPPDIRGMIEQESLIYLFDQTRRSGKARFRYSNDFGGIPLFMVAVPIDEQGETVKILLLKTMMGDNFLREVTASLDVSATLLTLDGKVLARSDQDSTEMKLSPAQMSLVGTGQPLFIDHENSRGAERHLFTIIPLGSSDLVMLSLQDTVKETSVQQQRTLWGMITLMIAVVVLGTIFYFRRVSNITRPARELRNATEAVSRGNLNYRIVEISDDELGQIAISFNQMAVDLETSYQERADKDIANAIAQEESKTRKLLEKKQIEQDRISEELSNLQRESSALYQLNQAMTASIDLGTLFDRILQVLNEIVACDRVVLLLHNHGESLLEVARASGLDAEALSDVHFAMNQGITGEAAQSQKSIYVRNIEEDKRNLSYHGKLVTRGSMISSPLINKGHLVGILNLHKNQVDAFPVSEQKLINAISNQTAIAIDNSQLQEKSRDASNVDDLTGLSNRRHFQEILKREVAQARRFSSNFSIIMCDIDDFKQHKKNLGKIHSDALLKQVGQFLLKTTRGIDLVSRFGKDQFILLLPKTNKKGSMAAAEKLRQKVAKENFSTAINTEISFDVTISCGITEFPIDSKNIYELLNLADRALYAAKKDGGNCSVSWEGPAPGPE